MSAEPQAPTAGAPQTAPAPTPPPGSSKTPVIILVLVVLLLCCCCVTASAGIAFYTGLSEAMTPLSGSVEPYDPVPPELTYEEAALNEWYAWEPSVADFAYTPPSVRQRDIAEAIVAELYPGLDLREVYTDPGSYDGERDVEEADLYIFSAHPPDNPEVDIAGFFYAPSEAGEASGEPFRQDTVYEDDEVLTLYDGMEYIAPRYKLPLRGEITDEVYALLATAAEDWPGGVVAEVYLSEDGSTATISVTTWDHYASTSEFEAVEATYVLQDGAWVLDSYEWILPDE